MWSQKSNLESTYPVFQMEKPLITSLSNPLIKQARALRQKKARLESGLFLVEGIHHVGEAVEAGWKVESILDGARTIDQ